MISLQKPLRMKTAGWFSYAYIPILSFAYIPNFVIGFLPGQKNHAFYMTRSGKHIHCPGTDCIIP